MAKLLPQSALPVEAMNALQAAHAANAWIELHRALTETTQVQLMALAWQIRREYSDREAFLEFVRERVNIKPDSFWLMADAWEAGLENRQLRQFCRRAPAAALDLVAHMVERGSLDRVKHLDPDDRELVAIFAAPPRKAADTVRRLLEADRRTKEENRRHRSPEDAAYIEKLEGEVAEERHLREEAAAAAERRDTVAGAIEELADVESRLARLNETFTSLHPALNQRAKERVLRLADLCIISVEGVSGVCVCDSLEEFSPEG